MHIDDGINHMLLLVLALQLMNGTEEEQDSPSRYQDIRIFSLFPAKSDMLWYDLRGIQLPWTVPSMCDNYMVMCSTCSSILCVAFSISAGLPFTMVNSDFHQQIQS